MLRARLIILAIVIGVGSVGYRDNGITQQPSYNNTKHSYNNTWDWTRRWLELATTQVEPTPTERHEHDILLQTWETGHSLPYVPPRVALAIGRYAWPYDEAIRVFDCESGLRPTEEGEVGERGIAQIARVHIPLIIEMGYIWDDMYKVEPNIHVAWRLYSGSYSWLHWRFSKYCHGY